MFYVPFMDWPHAMERNRTALVEIVALIFAMVGLSVGGTVEKLPPAVRAMALRLPSGAMTLTSYPAPESASASSRTRCR